MSRIGRALISSDDSTGAVTLPSAPDILPTIQGGTGQDTSASTGIARVDAGLWSFTDDLTVEYGEWVQSVDAAGTGTISLVRAVGAGGNVAVGNGEGTDGGLWLNSASLNSSDCSNGDVIIGYNKHFRSTDSDNDWTRKLIGCETIGGTPDCVVLGDNSLACAVGTPGAIVNTPGGSMTFANDRGVRAVNAATDDTINLIKLDTSDRVQLGQTGSLVNYFPAIPVIATASLPAAAASMDGCVCIEDNGAGDRNLILYAGSQRFRIDGGAAF